MSIPTAGWFNKGGTADRTCVCGSWQQHWVNFARKPWPVQCSVEGCNCRPTVGGHVVNPSVEGERIVPLCNSCNGLTTTFSLKGGIAVPSANKAETCERMP